jgi:hypothetical protein
MRNIEAPKALSQFRAWGIAPGDQIAVDQSAESAVSIQRVVFNPQPTRGGGESRFQRCTLITHASWGAAPG